MNIAILFAILLSASLATAETIIIEYPDHFYVESSGSPNGKPAASREVAAPPPRPMPLPPRESIATPDKNKENKERREAWVAGIERLQREYDDLMISRVEDTPDQINNKQQEALGKLRKIKRISSELKNLKDPSEEQKP